MGEGLEAGNGRAGAQPGESVQAYLRRATRPWHDAVEGGFAPFDLATLDGLGAFLLRQAAAVLPLERALDAAGVALLVPDWALRRRSGALEADLRSLGLRPPHAVPGLELPSRAHALGALYVLEGSKLGGRVLLRAVVASPDARVRAASRFLGHHQPGSWQRFTACLNASAPDALGEILAGAEGAFALFRAVADDNPMAMVVTGNATAPLVHFVRA